jgi:uncharacterized protein (TIGR03437 family)
MMKAMRYLFWMTPICIIVGMTSTLSAQVSVRGFGYTAPTPPIVAPGEVTTLFVSGLPYIPTPLVATTTPLPPSLGGISVGLQQGSQSFTAPLFRVQQSNSCADASDKSNGCMVTAITLQVPFELAPGVGTVGTTISENGIPVSKAFALAVDFDHMHVLTYCDIVFGTPVPPLGCVAIVTHPDFTPVTQGFPAAAGEVVTIWAVGLGVSQPRVPTGQATPLYVPTGANAPALRVGFDFSLNAAPYSAWDAVVGFPELPPPQVATFVGLTPGYVGLYQINVPIPQPLPAVDRCSITLNLLSNLTINLRVGNSGSSDGAPLCVAPPLP